MSAPFSFRQAAKMTPDALKAYYKAHLVGSSIAVVGNGECH